MNHVNRWRRVIHCTLINLIDHDGLNQAKAAAYSFLMFFFPLLLVLVIAAIMSDVTAILISRFMSVFSGLMPPNIELLIVDYIGSISTRRPIHLLWSSLVLMVWSGSGLMINFMNALDRAYDIKTRRSALNQRSLAIGLVFLVGVPLGCLALVVIFGSLAERLLADLFNLTIPWFWKLARWAVTLVSTVIMIGLIYYVGPQRSQRWQQVLPGAILATSLWMLTTLGFSAYVNNFGKYDLFYGSLGAGIVLLIWMYISSLVVFIGGEFNAVLEANTNDVT